MRHEARKAAVSAYKERKSEPGIYALTCQPTGEKWVGRAPDFGAVENRLRFTLRTASTPHRALAAAARAHGEAAFRFEIIERIDSEQESPELVAARLRNRLDHWREALAAEAI